MTATATRPPSEEDVRAIEAAYRARYSESAEHLDTAVDYSFAVIDYRISPDEDEHPLGAYVWTNLRPTEAARLRELVEEGRQRALERAREAITAEIVAAAMQFASEFPDAPRAIR